MSEGHSGPCLPSLSTDAFPSPSFYPGPAQPFRSSSHTTSSPVITWSCIIHITCLPACHCLIPSEATVVLGELAQPLKQALSKWFLTHRSENPFVFLWLPNWWCHLDLYHSLKPDVSSSYFKDCFINGILTPFSEDKGKPAGLLLSAYRNVQKREAFHRWLISKTDVPSSLG